MLKQIECVSVGLGNKANQAHFSNQQIEELPSDVVLVSERLELVADERLKFMLSLCLQSYIHYQEVN